MVSTIAVWMLIATGNVHGGVVKLSEHATLADCLDTKSKIQYQLIKTPGFDNVVLKCHNVVKLRETT